jgi:hypothetical protein
MNKTLKLALGMVLSIGILGSAIAQDQFPDVPENHWAYEALANMKRNGLLVGYPDGLFRGGRPATRYEMAVAIHATYQHLKNITDGLQSQIDDLKKPGSPVDLGPIRDALEALQRDVNSMKGWGDDINNLKRMAATFEKELASMGVDVEAMKKDLKDLNDRVTKLEKNALPITVHGDVNFFIQAGKGTSGRFGLGTDGQLVGGTTENATRASGLLDGLSVFHEANLKIAGTNEEGPKWHAVLTIGNMLNGYGSTTMATAAGGSRNDEAVTDFGFRRLVAEFDESLLGQSFGAKIGRMGYKISPYIYMAPDTNPYFNSAYDKGEWTMDGALLGFNFGSAKFNVLLGRTNGRNTSAGTDLSGVSAGALGAGAPGVVGYGPSLMAADTTFGAHLNLPLGDKGGVDLAYLIHSGNTPAGVPAVDNVHVFGGDLKYNFGAIALNAGYSQSNVFVGKRTVVNKNNFAWHLMANYETERWGLGAGYREIQRHFAAAGDWGRIGTWWNPTDVKGFHVAGHFDFSDNLTLNARAEFLSGIGKNNIQTFNGSGVFFNGLRTSDKVDSYKIDLNYNMSNGWNAMLGGEFVDFRPTGATSRATQRWYTLGLGYNLSEYASLRLMWQISDAEAKTTGLWAAPGNATGRFSGNLITTQLSIKF